MLLVIADRTAPTGDLADGRDYVGAWIEEHPTSRESTKEPYRGLLRTCITRFLAGRGGDVATPRFDAGVTSRRAPHS